MHQETTSPSPSSRNFFHVPKSFRRTVVVHCSCQNSEFQCFGSVVSVVFFRTWRRSRQCARWRLAHCSPFLSNAPYCRAGPCWPPRVVLPPQKMPAMRCHVATDTCARPDDRAAHWIRRSSEQEARASTGEIDAEALKKTTLSTEPNTETLNFLNLNRNSACQLFDEMILACGKFFWS